MSKNRLIGNAIITTALGILVIRSRKDKLVYMDQLPITIHEYIKLHFASHRISKAIQHRAIFKGSYEVHLNGGVSLEFDKNGHITIIEGNSKLPDTVIPSKVLVYISTNYHDNIIVKWKSERKYQEIELDSGLELIFDLDGNFLGLEF